MAADREYLFFVNPDARLVRGASAALLEVAEAEPEAGALGPFILGPGGDRGALNTGFEPSLRSSIGHFLFAARFPLVGGWFPPLQLPAGSETRHPDWVSGAAMLVRRDGFRAVGGFDAAMFMYMEDVDLCRRLREHGSRIRYVPEARVRHELGGSQGADQAERWYRAFHAYLVAHRGAAEARASALSATVGLGARALVLLRRNPAQARRLARSARCACRLAFRGDRAGSPRAR
jgi:N-acetylglucosaminyl-diphospho-decaprenol L-rhamnosyltransferase